MNVIREIERINTRELKSGNSGSWHDDYKDSAWIYAGGLNYKITEGDIIAIFSQYGEIEDMDLVRDKETGKSKGFAFVKYEDARSCVLAVDNFNGISLAGRILRVDHCRDYRKPKSHSKADGKGGEGLEYSRRKSEDYERDKRRELSRNIDSTTKEHYEKLIEEPKIKRKKYE